MIYEMTRDIAARLSSRKFPTVFAYGPTRVALEQYDPIVIVERDDASDTIETAHGFKVNPRLVMTRKLAVKTTIFAKSNLPGARRNEHEDECEQTVDAFLTELHRWIVEARAGTAPELREARYLKPGERDEVETWPGVVYVLRYYVARGVRVLDWTGAARPTAVVDAVGNEVHVYVNGVPPPEIVELP